MYDIDLKQLLLAKKLIPSKKCCNIFIIDNVSVVNEGNFESLFKKKFIN